MSNYLLIDNVLVALDSTIVIRWVDTLEGKSVPILYKNGKRVTKSWEMVFSCYSKEDPHGSNANTN
jgi:hypothetical protein